MGIRDQQTRKKDEQIWSSGTTISEKRYPNTLRHDSTSTSNDLLPPPFIIGLPEKYTSWRRMQQTAVLAAENSDKRFILQCAPTGFGKSLVYMANASMLDLGSRKRTIILTSTKGLQDQLGRDFSELVVDVRGQNAYTCIKARDLGIHPETSVSEAPCHVGVPCDEKQGRCHYYSQVAKARTAPIVVANYAFWLYQTQFGEGLGEFDLMVLDEAHDCPDIISDFLSVTVKQEELRLLNTHSLGQGITIEEWRTWAAYHREKLKVMTDAKMVETRTLVMGGKFQPVMVKKKKELETLLRKFERLSTMNQDWVVEETEEVSGYGMKAKRDKVIHFNPLWPSRYAESTLFQGIKKVVMFSATVRPKTATLLGLTPQVCDFNEYPSTFPIERRKVIYIPTIKVGMKTSEGEMRRWMARIDEIIRPRRDRKGIIHTVSFKRRNFVLQHSEFADLMLSNDSRNTRDVVQAFKGADAPRILISPSMTTGWDFPYEECEYQIICKIMFPDTSQGVMKARNAADKDYGSYIAMQNLVQATGRGMRAEDDQCEVFVIDDNMCWFMARYKDFAPKWWKDALVMNNGPFVPQPLTKLQRTTS